MKLILIAAILVVFALSSELAVALSRARCEIVAENVAAAVVRKAEQYKNCDVKGLIAATNNCVEGACDTVSGNECRSLMQASAVAMLDTFCEHLKPSYSVINVKGPRFTSCSTMCGDQGLTCDGVDQVSKSIDTCKEYNALVSEVIKTTDCPHGTPLCSIKMKTVMQWCENSKAVKNECDSQFLLARNRITRCLCKEPEASATPDPAEVVAVSGPVFTTCAEACSTRGLGCDGQLQVSQSRELCSKYNHLGGLVDDDECTVGTPACHVRAGNAAHWCTNGESLQNACDTAFLLGQNLGTQCLCLYQ